MNLPIKGMKLERINSHFGHRIHPITKVDSFHYGIDYPTPVGTPIRAVDGGKVIVSKMQNGGRGLGEYITILHPDNTYSMYAHLSKRQVYTGNIVKAGQQIGLSGNTGDSTGAHLHFGLCRKYVAANVNKSQWFDPEPKLKEVDETEMVKKTAMKSTEGKLVDVDAINKDATNYIKLRDLPKLIPGVEVGFEGHPYVKMKENEEIKQLIDWAIKNGYPGKIEIKK